MWVIFDICRRRTGGEGRRETLVKTKRCVWLVSVTGYVPRLLCDEECVFRCVCESHRGLACSWQGSIFLECDGVGLISAESRKSHCLSQRVSVCCMNHSPLVRERGRRDIGSLPRRRDRGTQSINHMANGSEERGAYTPGSCDGPTTISCMRLNSFSLGVMPLL